MTLSLSTPRRLAALAFIVGCGLRIPPLPYTTPDATDFLLPWYGFARQHGVASLGEAFTNYAPFYSYLLIVATWFDGIATPLTLIKAISFVFELGSAFVAAKLVAGIDPRPGRAALAFAFVWLAPNVLHNGAFWGQADAIWTFFLLLFLLGICRGRPGLGVIAFAVAIAVKAQAVFLAPLVLGLALNGTMRLRWLVAVPFGYLMLALPTLLFGRSFASVALVYWEQAGTYRSLSMNAANLYVFAPPSLYELGSRVGLALAAAAGLAFALTIGRSRRLGPDAVLLAAAVSLLLMPFMLPKMHERYFYAFEIVVIVLAVVRPALGPVALLAQVCSALSYFPFDGLTSAGLPIAALTNAVLLVFLASRLRIALAGRPGAFVEPDWLLSAICALWLAYALQLGLLNVLARWADPATLWPSDPTDLRGFALFAVLAAGAAAALLRRRASAPTVASPI